MAKAKEKVTVRPYDPGGVHLSGCRMGTFIQFLEGSHHSRTGAQNSWDTKRAYLYLGTVGRTKYARVLDIEGEFIIERVPRVSKVRKLRLVSIELEIAAEDEEHP